jgi:hypothetical protein
MYLPAMHVFQLVQEEELREQEGLGRGCCIPGVPVVHRMNYQKFACFKIITTKLPNYTILKDG